MVQNIDTEKREVTIKLQNADTCELVNMQKALIDLVKHYDYKNFGSNSNDTIYYALRLLESILPDLEQQERGIKSLIDNEKREVSIKLQNADTCELVNMQKALINLVQHYDFEHFGSDVNETIYYALRLLESILPDLEQQENGFNSLET